MQKITIAVVQKQKNVVLQDLIFSWFSINVFSTCHLLCQDITIVLIENVICNFVPYKMYLHLQFSEIDFFLVCVCESLKVVKRHFVPY